MVDKSVDNSSANILNISYHMFFLFVFLSLFFFFYVSKITKTHIENEIDSLIKKNLPQYLDQLKMLDNSKILSWDLVKEISLKLEDIYKEESQFVKAHNSKLKILVISFIIVSLVTLTFVSYLLRDKVDIKHLLTENIVIFVFVGLLEFIFFLKIASQYVPVDPAFLTKVIVQRFQTYVNTNQN